MGVYAEFVFFPLGMFSILNYNLHNLKGNGNMANVS